MSVYNPYLPLDTYIPDGEPHVFGDRLYVFGSHDKEGGDAYCLLDYEAWSAPVDDLTSWRCEGTIYCKEQDPTYDPNGEYRAMYAPDVVQGPDGRYYLYYAMAGKAFTGPMHVAVCDTPAGKYEYYGFVRNPDGTVFDRCITFDPGLLNDNGRIWLYYGWAVSAPNMRGMKGVGRTLTKRLVMPVMERKLFDKTSAQIKREPNGIQGANVVELEQDMLTVKSGPKRIVPGLIDGAGTEFEGNAFFEASSIRKIDGTYYYIYSNEKYHELCYATSDRPDGDFHYRGVLVDSADLVRDDRLPKKQTEFTTNNHGSLVEVNGQWYIFYHRHTHKTAYSRQGMADKITLMPDGSFQQAEVTSCGLNPEPLPAEGTYPAPIACRICNGKYPFVFGKNPFPNVNHKDDERFIGEITHGTRIEYKYFAFNGPCKLVLKMRGNAYGTVTVSIDKEVTRKISITPSSSWKEYSLDLDTTGTHMLRLDFAGKGEAELLELRFEN